MKPITIIILIIILVLFWTVMSAFLGYTYARNTFEKVLLIRPDTTTISTGTTTTIPAVPDSLTPTEIIRYIEKVKTVTEVVIKTDTMYVGKYKGFKVTREDEPDEEITTGKIKLDNYFLDWYFMHKTGELILKRPEIKIDVPKIPKRLFRLGISCGVAGSKDANALLGIGFNLPKLNENLFINLGATTMPDNKLWALFTYYL